MRKKDLFIDLEVQGMGYDKIAEILNTKPETIKNWNNELIEKIQTTTPLKETIDKLEKELDKTDFSNRNWDKLQTRWFRLDNKRMSIFRFYYDSAKKALKEKNWFRALEMMCFVIHYLGKLGGATQEKFILRLLGKYDKKDKIIEYIGLAVNGKPKNFETSLRKLLNLNVE